MSDRNILAERLAVTSFGDIAEMCFGYEATIDRLSADLAAERERRETAERQRDEMAAALGRQAAKCRKWRDTFESLDEDLFAAEAHDALHAIYRTSDDEAAQDMASAILAARDAARDADQRRKGAAWVLTLENECWCDCCRRALLESIKSGEVEVQDE